MTTPSLCSTDSRGWRFCHPHWTKGVAFDGDLRYRVMEGYPKFDYNFLEPSSATMQILIESTDLPKWVDVLFPQPLIYNNKIKLPEQAYLWHAFHEPLYAISASVEPQHGTLPADPYGKDSTNSGSKSVICDGEAGPADGTYDDKLLMTINFSTNSMARDRDEDKPETFTTTTITGGADFAHRPAEKLKHDDGSPSAESPAKALADPNVNVSITNPHITFTVDWRFAVAPDFANIADLMGKINSTTYDWLPGAETGEALFVSYTATPKFIRYNQVVSPTGNPAGGESYALPMYDISFVFSQKFYRKVTGASAGEITSTARKSAWLFAWVPKDQDWRRLLQRVTGGETAPLYQSADFSTLFNSTIDNRF